MTTRGCVVEGCDRPHEGKGYCMNHRRRLRLYGDPLGSPAAKPPKPCTVEGCRRKRSARGYCGRHHQRWVKHGDPLAGDFRNAEGRARNRSIPPGSVFGRLTLTEGLFVAEGHTAYRARCACGRDTVVAATSLFRREPRRQQSYGCLRRDTARERSTTHGKAGTPEFRAWSYMLTRCTNRNSTDYHAYGGRGITIHPPWAASFAAFLSDMGPKPGPGYSLDRIDVNGDYEPGNCRWATGRGQCRNKRNNVRLTAHGETLTAVEWSERTGINYFTLVTRIKQGRTPEEALTPGRLARPKQAPKLCTAEGCDRPHLARGYCGLHYQRHRAATAVAA